MYALMQRDRSGKYLEIESAQEDMMLRELEESLFAED